jgi:hypothetical protein
VLSIAIIAPKQSWKKIAKRNRKWTSIFITLSVSYLAYLSYINNQNQNGNVRRMKIKGNRVNMIPIREREYKKFQFSCIERRKKSNFSRAFAKQNFNGVKSM